MNFSRALERLKKGERVLRSGWNGKGMWLALIADYRVLDPCVDALPLLPWIGLHTAQGAFVPWLASQTDILAEDWE
jgi:hypothetical protein